MNPGAPSAGEGAAKTPTSERLIRLVRHLLDAVPQLSESDPLIHLLCREFSRRELIEMADNDFRREVANAVWDEWESWNAEDNWFPEGKDIYIKFPKHTEDN